MPSRARSLGAARWGDSASALVSAHPAASGPARHSGPGCRPAACCSADGSGHTADSGRAQRRGDPVAAVDDVADGHPEVDVCAVAGTPGGVWAR